MPAVMNTPEHLEHIETYNNLTIERSLAQRERPGFWHTLGQRMRAYLTLTPYQRHVPACYKASRPCQTAVDQLVLEHPSFAPYALAII